MEGIGRVVLRIADDVSDDDDVRLRSSPGLVWAFLVPAYAILALGQQRILFDLWGATVNTAARMQSTGVPGRIHVSEGTMERTSHVFRFEARTVDVKGLGSLTSFLLVHPAPDVGQRQMPKPVGGSRH